MAEDVAALDALAPDAFVAAVAAWFEGAPRFLARLAAYQGQALLKRALRDEDLAASRRAEQQFVQDASTLVPTQPDWPEHSALDAALTTDRKLWPESTVEKLRPILERFIYRKRAPVV